MSASGGTAVVRDWTFVLYPERRPSGRDSDAFDHANALAGGETGREEDPGGCGSPARCRVPRQGRR